MAAAAADNSNYSPETHVLMVAFAAQGHINPMLRFAKRLSSKGLTVTLATTEIVRHRMFNFNPTTPNTPLFISGIQILFFPDGFPVDYDRKSNLDLYLNTLAKIGPISLSNLIKSHFHNHNLRCIISNPFVPWVVNVAAQYNLPCAMLWIQPCSLFSIYYQYYYNNQNLDSSKSISDIQFPGLPLLQTQDLPSFLLDSKATSITQLLIDLFKLYIKKHRWVLANSFSELEKEAVKSLAEICPVIPVGPLVLDDDSSGIDFWKPEENCLD